MRGLIRGLAVVAVAGAAALWGASLWAQAESRLFTVRTDASGVTVTRATVNGRDLQVAGQSGGSTFFRIDNPAGAVPCNNRVQFTTSTNRVFDVTADFCANNWEIVLGVAANTPAPAPQPAPAPAPPPAVAVPAPQIGQPVVITTDDPTASILEVFLRGQPVPINARQGNYVRIVAPTGPQGLECQRDLGLALSDGRRIARLVDICQSNFVVTVALTGGPRPPAPPPTFLPQPTQPIQPQPGPQPVPQPPVAQPVPQPGAPEFVNNMTWTFDPLDGRNAALHYMIPNSEISEFSAQCAAGAGQMTVTLNRAPPTAQPGQQLRVQLTAGGFSQIYSATMGPVNEVTSRSHPVMRIAASDGLWPALARENAVAIAIDGVPPYALSLRGSAANVRPFLAFCTQAAVPPAPTPIPPVGPGPSVNAVGFQCDDGSFLSVGFDQSAAVVSEPGLPPVVLYRAPPSPEGAVYAAGMSRLIGRSDSVSYFREGAYPRTCYRT